MKDLPDDLETFLLLALSDSNLPTGGFVASSGLESTCLHGFLPLHYDLEAPATLSTVQSVVAFIDKSLTSYSRLAMAFVNDAHDLVCSVEPNDGFRQAREELVSLSTLHDAMLLNHVARRASKAQGAALLSLYVRSFAPPLPESGIKRPIDQLVDEIRISIRSGSFEAHLPVCWGILCAAVGLSAGMATCFLRNRRLLIILQQKRQDTCISSCMPDPSYLQPCD